MPSSCEHQYNQSCSSLHQVNWNAIQSKACKGQLHPDVCTNHALDTQFDAVYRVNQPCGIQPCSYKWIQSKCNGCNTKESLVELEIDYHPPFPMAMTSNVWECISNPTSGPTHHWWHQWRWLAKLFPPWQWAGVVASIHQQQQARGGGHTQWNTQVHCTQAYTLQLQLFSCETYTEHREIPMYQDQGVKGYERRSQKTQRASN